MQVVILPDDLSELAQIVAALELGNAKVESGGAVKMIATMRDALKADRQHVLFLRDREDLGDFFGCGTYDSLADSMVEDRGTIAYGYEMPADECPNCREDEE